MRDWERRLRELVDILDATMPGNTHAQHIRACLAALDAARALARELRDGLDEALCYLTPERHNKLLELFSRPDVRALGEER